jgi:hypothetical protein
MLRVRHCVGTNLHIKHKFYLLHFRGSFEQKNRTSSSLAGDSVQILPAVTRVRFMNLRLDLLWIYKDSTRFCRCVLAGHFFQDRATLSQYELSSIIEKLQVLRSVRIHLKSDWSRIWNDFVSRVLFSAGSEFLAVTVCVGNPDRSDHSTTYLIPTSRRHNLQEFALNMRVLYH